MADQKHEMRKLTSERLAEVAIAWEDLAGQDEFAVELRPLFDWCASHMSPRDGDGQAFELVNLETQQTDALLEVVDSRWGSMTKLLKVAVSPVFWDLEERQKVEQLLWVYIGAFLQILQTGIQKQYASVKIYGRNDSLLTILKRLQLDWPETETGFAAKMEGRWLHVTLTKEKK